MPGEGSIKIYETVKERDIFVKNINTLGRRSSMCKIHRLIDLLVVKENSKIAKSIFKRRIWKDVVHILHVGRSFESYGEFSRAISPPPISCRLRYKPEFESLFCFSIGIFVKSKAISLCPLPDTFVKTKALCFISLVAAP